MRRFVHVSRLLAAFIVMIGVFIPLVPVDTAEAVSGSCYFTSTAGPVKSTSGCSEIGYGDYGTNDVLTGRSTSGNGSAIPLSVNTKTEFINYIVNRFNNGSDHNQIGAAFIMQEMRNSRAWPGSRERDDWVQRMKASDVTVKSKWDSSVGRTSYYDDDKKNVFYGDHPNVGRQVIEIRQDGKLIAQIEHLCGNTVAGAKELKDPWDVDPFTTVSPSPTIVVGQTITWKHTITNKGPGSMTEGGTYKINSDVPVTTPTGSYAAHSDGWVGGPLTRTYVTKASDINKKYCQSLTITPNSSTSSKSETSDEKCVKVVGSYDLTPEAKLDTTGVVEAGAEVDVTGVVTNNGPTSSATEWQLTKTIVEPGDTIPLQTKDNASLPCAWFANTCTIEDSNTRTFSGTVTVADLSNQAIPDRPVGTKICWAVSVKPPTSTSTDWRHSAPVCVTIGKKPKVQVLGGDTRVRGNIRTSISVVDLGGNKTFGSWTEFGVMSTGDNIAMASGAGLRKGSGSPSQSSWSNLTFANVKPFGADASEHAYGTFGSLPDAAAIAQYFGNQTSTVVGNNFSLNGKASGVYRASGDVTVSGSTNKSIIIMTDGAVTISGSGISYSGGSFSSLKDVPQVIIIAKDIRINDSVTTVDAWLIASNSINTCANKVANTDTPALSANICDQALTINGPVATSELYLFRTAGSGTGGSIRNPAETFNLRPETYLWAYNYGLSRSQPTTASVVELPPRY